MRTLVVVTALILSSLVAGCASAPPSEAAARSAWSTRSTSTTRFAYVLGPDQGVERASSTRAAGGPLTHREQLRAR